MRRFVFACLIAACAAMAPSWASAGDQEIAQHIVQQLSEAKQAGQLKGFDLDLHVDQGTVWLKGFVANDAQKKLVIDAARQGKSLGVTQIVDDITVRAEEPTVAARPEPVSRPAASVASSRRSTPAPTQVAPARTQVAPARTQVAPAQMQVAPVADEQVQTVQHQQIVPVRGPQQVPVQAAARPMAPRSSMPLAAGPAGMPQQQGPAYMPASNGRPAGAYYDQPNVPNYAWPSYAAHPNYSAVTYPTQYSPTAWPYIGPFYPYPQVPLGWRKVTLEWDDGWWMLDFHDR